MKIKVTQHPLNPDDAAALAALRPMLSANKGLLQGTAARAPFDDIMQHTPDAEGVTYQEDIVGGISGWWVRPANARADGAILHLHGGWFNWGSAKAYRNFVGHVAAIAGTAAFIPDYRLAPENPFPAAPKDAQAAYDGLIDRGIKRVAVVGDSAGGALALGLRPRVKPVGIVALSPVTDLSQSGPSWETRDAFDIYFTRAQAAALIASYLGDEDPTNPVASPLFANLASLPPIRVHVGEDELLLDDSIRFVERAAAAGVDATVDVWQGMLHVFPASVGRLQAASEALNAIGAFLAERFAIALTHPAVVS